jgi:MFS family permease
VAVGRIVMDIIASNTVLFSYNIRETPFYPSPFSLDFTVAPLIYMVVYQYSPAWQKYLAWSMVATGIICFGVFPIFITFGFLKQNYNWNSYYAFIAIMFIAILSRAVMLKILHVEQRYQCGHSSSSSMAFAGQLAMKPLDHEGDSKDK